MAIFHSYVSLPEGIQYMTCRYLRLAMMAGSNITEVDGPTVALNPGKGSVCDHRKGENQTELWTLQMPIVFQWEFQDPEMGRYCTI